MIQATIKVDGKYYVGEHLNKTAKVEQGSLTTGFYPNNNREVNKLKWTTNKSEAYEAYGARGIKSALDKIEQRMRMGLVEKNAKIKVETLD